MSKFFVCWEITRYINALARTVICIGAFSFLVPYSKAVFVLDIVLGCITLIDFYIRMHCQYYNEQGILVSHPLYTAKHYFKTLFLIDLWCISSVLKHNLQVEEDNHSYVWTSNAIYSMLTYPVHIYRLIFGLNYLKSNLRSGRQNTILVLQYTLFTVTVLALCGTFVQLTTCRISMDAEQKLIVSTYFYKF